MKLCWEVTGSGVMCEGSPYTIALELKGYLSDLRFSFVFVL